MKKREELTTEMHSEFLGDEIPKKDLYIMAVYGAIRRGVPMAEALKKYDLTEEEYNANIKRVLSCPDY